ncbi:hypothetical protein [Sphingomonas sp. R86521]|uniref:hypothetical protein n=1 Tax=Sphingomonas sp. R86521 TaxID=3093860 RepID=UPI0036D23F73
METALRLLRFALPLAAKSNSHAVCALIETAINLSLTRIAALRAEINKARIALPDI